MLIRGAGADGLFVLPVLSAAAYSGVVSQAVVAFKDHERVRLREALAPALGRAARLAAASLLAPHESALLVTPPGTLASRLRRGRSPLHELLVAADLPPAVTPAFGLVRWGPTDEAASLRPGAGQKGRSAAGRRSSAPVPRLTAEGRRVLPGSTVLLADDVLTTGSTLKRLSMALSAAGAQVRGGVVLAAAAR